MKKIKIQIPYRVPFSGPAIRANHACVFLTACTLCLGCRSRSIPEQGNETRTTGDTVTMTADSPQLAALTIEPVGAAQKSSVPLSGRLVWDEDVTVRVFSPFAGIVRKLGVNVSQAITRGMALAEIESADFGQALAEARKAESDLRRAERNLTRLRDLAEHGAAPKKDLESADADYVAAEAENERASARLAIYGATTKGTDHGFLLPSPLSG